MKKVLDTYSSKNDINIKQIVAYKDNILEIEEYNDGFKKDDTYSMDDASISILSLHCNPPRLYDELYLNFLILSTNIGKSHFYIDICNFGGYLSALYNLFVVICHDVQ